MNKIAIKSTDHLKLNCSLQLTPPIGLGQVGTIIALLIHNDDVTIAGAILNCF